MDLRTALATAALTTGLGGSADAFQDEARVNHVRVHAYSVLEQHLDHASFRDAPPATRGLILRALQLAGWRAGDPKVERHRETLFALDAATHAETLVHRLLLRLEGGEGVRTEGVVRDLVALTRAQATDGGWDLDPDAEPDREERITITALALEALSRTQSRGGPVPDVVFDRAAGFLRSQVRRGGAFGESPRRGRPHGHATAAAATALWVLVARERDPETRVALEELLDAAEGWLDDAFRTDRNPNALTGKYPFLWWMSVYEGRAWVPLFAGRERHAATCKELVESALSSAGWNERVLAGSGGAAPPPGAPRYGTPLNFDAGVCADLRDTAWGVLTLFRAEWSHPLEDALATRRLLARLERFGARRTPLEEVFVARARLADDRVLPHLLDGLESDRSAPRRAAVGALRARAHRTFDYDPQLGPSRNREAIAAWEAWVAERLATLPADPPIPERRRRSP